MPHARSLHYSFILFFIFEARRAHWSSQQWHIASAHTHTECHYLFFPSSSRESYVKLGSVHCFIISRFFFLFLFIFKFVLFFPSFRWRQAISISQVPQGSSKRERDTLKMLAETQELNDDECSFRSRWCGYAPSTDIEHTICHIEWETKR